MASWPKPACNAPAVLRHLPERYMPTSGTCWYISPPVHCIGAVLQRPHYRIDALWLDQRLVPLQACELKSNKCSGSSAGRQQLHSKYWLKLNNHQPCASTPLGGSQKNSVLAWMLTTMSYCRFSLLTASSHRSVPAEGAAGCFCVCQAAAHRLHVAGSCHPPTCPLDQQATNPSLAQSGCVSECLCHSSAS